MKLRNLIFALFLVIGAIGFVSCTGDDGETGPQGEQGPPGDQGPPGADAGDVELSYPFLKNWGAASGMASCSSEVLTGTGVFPGLAELKMIVDANGQAAPVRVNAACSGGSTTNLGLVGVNPDLDGNGVADGTTTPGLVFNITHKGTEKVDPTPVPPQGDANPRVKTETRHFSGGTVHAMLPATGVSDESFYRSLLSHECSVGTPSPAIMGTFRAVRKVETDTVLEVSDTGATEGTYVPIAATAVTKTTHKVCVILDSLPGVTKCFASVVVAGDGVARAAAIGMTAGTTETVGIYDGDTEMLDPVAPKPVGTATTLADVTGASADNLGILNLDEPAPGATEGDGVIDNDVVQGKVCNLFLETTSQGGS